VHATEAQRFGGGEQAETGAWHRLVLYVGLHAIGVKRFWKLALAPDRNSPTQGKLGRAAQMRGLPASQGSLRRTRGNGSSRSSRKPSCFNGRTNPKALITATSAAAASSEALRYSCRSTRRRPSGGRGPRRVFSIHRLSSEKRYADSFVASFCQCAPGGGAALSFSRPGPTKCRKPSR
jgi:hypothetical protein